MEADAESKASRVIDKLLHAEMSRRGYLPVSVERTLAMSAAITLEIQVDNHYRPVQLHNGQHYLEANEGEAYSLVLKNPTYERKLVVLSVDGLNTLTGQPASYNGPGWIVPARGQVQVVGWKLNAQQGATFKFGSGPSTYSALSGHGTDNLGIIGAAVFDEALMKGPVYRHWSPDNTKGTGTPYPGSPSGPIWSSSVVRGSSTVETNGARETKTSGGLGTQFGEATAMPTMTVTFNRASTIPSHVISVRYATRAELTSWGVPVPSVGVLPQAFPGEGCKPPPGWQG